MTCCECGKSWADQRGAGRPRRYCSRSCQARAYRRRRDEGRLRSAARPAARRTGPDSDAAGQVDIERALDVAVALADRQGIGAVTFAALAGRTGASMSTLRQLVGTRDRLVALMAQRIVARSSREGRSGQESHRKDPPVERLRALAQEEWQRYLAHPWLVEVLASTRPPLVPAVLEASRAMVEAFVEMGFDADSALRRYLALSGYIQGMGLLVAAERQEAGSTGIAYGAWWADEVRRLDRTGVRRGHPWLAELTEQPHDAGDSFDADRAFQEGLGPILDGLAAGAPAA